MKIALAQINSTVGDLKGNQKKIIAFIQRAKKQQANIIVFPELSICGYPAEDLLLNQSFIIDSEKSCQTIAKYYSDNCLIILGSISQKNNQLYNSAIIASDGKINQRYHKMQLPNYGVFDEKRYFCAGDQYLIVDYQNSKLLISICEDIWVKDWLNSAPIKQCDILINISASPYELNKRAKRIKIIQSINEIFHKKVLLCNLVGAQDQLVFDGNSLFIDNHSQIYQAKHTKQDLMLVDLYHNTNHKKIKKDKNINEIEEIVAVLKLGIKDYVYKNKFKQVLLGLSGGIDSAVNLALLVNTLGKQNVLAVLLPTRYNSKASLDDAIEQAEILGNQYLIFDIDCLFELYLQQFKAKKLKISTISEQNIQARIRANILMAISNEQNRLLIATSNKSEIAVGYSTIYGDMSGAFCPLKDVKKTLVYQIADYLNQKKIQIPKNIITKAPSAELAHNQLDQDNLPDYALIDAIMDDFMIAKNSKNQLYQKYNKTEVDQVLNLLKMSEHKRFQAPPGIKISEQSFTKDWRYPISNQFEEC